MSKGTFEGIDYFEFSEPENNVPHDQRIRWVGFRDSGWIAIIAFRRVFVMATVGNGKIVVLGCSDKDGNEILPMKLVASESTENDGINTIRLIAEGEQRSFGLDPLCSTVEKPWCGLPPTDAQRYLIEDIYGMDEVDSRLEAAIAISLAKTKGIAEGFIETCNRAIDEAKMGAEK